MKNNAILSAGKTNPTSGTKIAGKNAAVILVFSQNFYLYRNIYSCKLYIKIS
jgi:hypothetical protein